MRSKIALAELLSTYLGRENLTMLEISTFL